MIDETQIPPPDGYFLEIPEGGLPSDPQALGMLYYQATQAEGVIKRIKEHVRLHLFEGGEVEGYDLRPGNKRSKITDTKLAYKILSEELEDLTADEFLKMCSVSLKDLAALYHIKREPGHTVQESAKDLQDLLSGVIETIRGAGVVVQAKPGNRNR
jgi:hypothetical protein